MATVKYHIRVLIDNAFADNRNINNPEIITNTKLQLGNMSYTVFDNDSIPVARTGQHAWLPPGWKFLPIRIGYCSDTNCARRFRCEDNNMAFTHVQPHF